MAADPKPATPSSSPGVRAAVNAAQRKVASNPGLRKRVQKLRKSVAKKRGEEEPQFAKPPTVIDRANPGIRRFFNRGKELDKILPSLKGK